MELLVGMTAEAGSAEFGAYGSVGIWAPLLGHDFPR